VSGSILAGKYLLAEQLGAGGMGVVYRAEHLHLARPVAIKFLHQILARDPQIAARFQLEALAAARLDHPNSVAVLDFGETPDGVPFIVMEYVRGRTLRQLAAGGLLEPARAIAITRQVLSALSGAHQVGIVHADVKTDNVLVAPSPDGERAKLVDFGLARIGRTVEEQPRDARGEPFVSGTPDYMAPEVILGATPAPAADIYAVGVMLYELLTGATPFGGGRSIDIFTRHVQDDLVPPSVRFPDRNIPRALEAALARSMEKEPERRFPSAVAFSTALAAVAFSNLLPPARGVVSHHATSGTTTLTLRRRAG
jgi:serine/threonine-protein kinase